MKKLLSLLLAVLMLACPLCLAGADNEAAELKFNSDGTFKILHITDSQDDQNPAYDMLNFVKKSVEYAKPDLIVFTGDVVEDKRIGDLGIDDESFREGVCVYEKGEILHDETLENIKTAVDAVLSILEETGVPYAIAQGNNDYKCSISTAEWLEIYSAYPHCLAVDMSNDSEGRIDYNLLIKGGDGKAKFNLWLMDTGKHEVCAEQVEWYKAKAASLAEENGGEMIPSFAFQHVEVPEIGNLFVECAPWESGSKASGVKFFRLNPETSTGKNVFTYAPGGESAEFKAWKETGDVVGAYFGHEHVEGFTGVYDGIELGFTYGCEFAKTGPYGFRLITLHEDDILNYDNELYIYKGSVKRGNDRFEKQEGNSYDESDSPVLKLFNSIINTVVSFVFVIVDLFR